MYFFIDQCYSVTISKPCFYMYIFIDLWSNSCLYVYCFIDMCSSVHTLSLTLCVLIYIWSSVSSSIRPFMCIFFIDLRSSFSTSILAFMCVFIDLCFESCPLFLRLYVCLY